MNPKIDQYIIDGCGRCKFYKTPRCKTQTWQDVLVQLRRIILDCPVSEELKWSMPTYTYKGKNLFILSAFREYTSINFFKGALLKDDHHLLVKPGENTQSGRQMRFTTVEAVLNLEPVIKAYILEAIEIEKSGIKTDPATKKEIPYPEELLQAMKDFPRLQSAFEALTPGRQRGYLMYFSAAKQAKTRRVRIEKCVTNILQGKGLN